MTKDISEILQITGTTSAPNEEILLPLLTANSISIGTGLWLGVGFIPETPCTLTVNNGNDQDIKHSYSTDEGAKKFLTSLKIVESGTVYSLVVNYYGDGPRY